MEDQNGQVGNEETKTVEGTEPEMNAPVNPAREETMDVSGSIDETKQDMTGEEADAVEEAANFDGFELKPEVARAVEEMGYEAPMQVQTETYADIMAGKDLLVQSRTGSGKTAAFGIPIVQGVVDIDQAAVQCLIICPTRELAGQVATELTKLGKHAGLKVAAVYGGAGIEPQIRSIKEGAQVVVGTPGRVLDHLRRKTLVPTNLKLFVLDECDEMLSMGFQQEILNIVSQLPTERQTLMFSATISEDVEELAKTYTRNAANLSLSDDYIGVKEVDHFYYMVTDAPRHRELVRVLQHEEIGAAIVFCNTREETGVVAKFLQQKGWKAEPISSDLTQKERERVMDRMRKGKIKVLVATDVAARGLDIQHVTHVINYSFPDSAEVYVHRTGRTGRAGKHGTAISLVTPQQIGSLHYVKLAYGIEPEERHLPSEQELASQREGRRYRNLVRSLPRDPDPEYASLARRLWHSGNGLAVFSHLLREYMGGNRPKSGRRPRSRDESNERPARQSARRDEREYSNDRHDDLVKLYVNLGRKDGLRTEDIRAFLTEESSVDEETLRQIRLRDTHTYVFVDPAAVDPFVERIRGKTFKGKSVVVEPARK
ncbi:MAG: DEAD/DEAH box helicase [Deltaproteobacteria bacterium]|nr:DEAD/DEAH box helicase [Deltaproteobacteria bacterium]